VSVTCILRVFTTCLLKEIFWKRGNDEVFSCFESRNTSRLNHLTETSRKGSDVYGRLCWCMFSSLAVSTFCKLNEFCGSVQFSECVVWHWDQYIALMGILAHNFCITASKYSKLYFIFTNLSVPR
jgi:hypothetical protein